MATKKVTKKKTGTQVARIEEQIQAQAAAMQNAVGNATGNRLRITLGKKFVSPDGDETPGPIEVVILDFNSQNLLWTAAYDKDNPVPPECFALSEPASLGGKITDMTPSDNSPDKQADDCASCPMNQFGTDDRGRGKACKNTRALAVISNLDPDVPQDEVPILLVSVSPGGLKRFDNYVRTLSSKGVTPITVVTELSLDPNEDYPSLHFKATGRNEHLSEHWARLEEAQLMLRAEPDLSSLNADTPAPKRPAKKKVAKKKAGRRSV